MSANQETPEDSLQWQYANSSTVPGADLANYENAAGSRRHGFFIGRLGILLPADMACEVASEMQICKLAGGPRWLAGMTNLRGNIVPVFDLTELFGMQVSNNNNPFGSQDRKLIFVQVGGEWAGFYSDGLPTRVILTPDQVVDAQPAMPWELKQFVSECYQQQASWLDCDIKKMLMWIQEQY